MRVSFECSHKLSSVRNYLFFLVLCSNVTKSSYLKKYSEHLLCNCYVKSYSSRETTDNTEKICPFPGWKWEYFGNKTNISRTGKDQKNLFFFFGDSLKNFSETILFFPDRFFYHESSINDKKTTFWFQRCTIRLY